MSVRTDHEGPEEDASETGGARLSSTAFHAKVRALFDAMHPTEGGKIEPQEFQGAMAHIGFPVTLGEIHDFVTARTSEHTLPEEKDALTFEVRGSRQAGRWLCVFCVCVRPPHARHRRC